MKSRINQTFLWGFELSPSLTSPKTTVPVKAYCPDSDVTVLDTGEDVFDISLMIRSKIQTVNIFLSLDRNRTLLRSGVTYDANEIADRIERAAAQGLLVLPERGVGRMRLSRDGLSFFEYNLFHKKREQFGDMAIRTALGIYQVFGVSRARENVGNFHYSEEKELFYKRHWISYSAYLCSKHKLI